MTVSRRILLPWALAGLVAGAVYLVDSWASRDAEAPPVRTELTRGETEWVLFPSGDVAPGGLADESTDIVPRLVAGRLTLPEGPGPFPAAVLVHGSLAPSAVQFDYADRLRERGYAVFVIDSFTARGFKDVVGNQLSVPAQTMTIDAYAALNVLSTHPSIAPDRIAVIGWSKGGAVAQLSMKRNFQNRLAAHGARFAAHVAFYPWCGEQDADLDLTGSPILFVLAGRDDWVDPQSCRDYAARLQETGQRVIVNELAEAEHGFDYPRPHRLFLPRAKAWGGCRYFIRPNGFVIASTGEFRPWHRLPDYFATCVRHGVHTGTHARARTAARNRLVRFLSAVLGESASQGTGPVGGGQVHAVRR